MISTEDCSTAVIAAAAPAAASKTGAAPFSTEAASEPPHVIDQHETIVGSQTPGELAVKGCPLYVVLFFAAVCPALPNLSFF